MGFLTLIHTSLTVTALALICRRAVNTSTRTHHPVFLFRLFFLFCFFYLFFFC
jgi:hypothetical protein